MSANQPYTQIAAELIDVLTNESLSTYPWSPASLEDEEFYGKMEMEFSLDDWSEEELNSRSESFFHGLHQCFDSVNSVNTSQLEVALQNKFARRIPQEWLAKLAQSVQSLIDSNLSLTEQLVQCTQAILPQWSSEDLLVLARPYAYAMRGESHIIDLEQMMRPVEWSELSEMEQAKITMMMARYALEQIKEG